MPCATSSACTSRADAARLRIAVAGIAVVGLLVVGAGCSGDPASAPPGTVGALPTPPTPETLLPVVTGTDVVETGTVAPDTLFGGVPCSALTDADLRSAASLVPPSATDPTIPDDELGAGVTAAATVAPINEGPVSTIAVSGDSCEFQVKDPVRYRVLVGVITVFDFESPVTVGTDGVEREVDAIAGVGDEAKGIDWGGRYAVLVRVADGWFAVESPDRASAVRLARAAAGRCCG